MLKRPPVWSIALALATIGLAAAAYYAWSIKLRAPDARAPAAAAASHGSEPEQIAQAAKELEARLKAAPDDAAGWMMLARSQMTLARFDAAAQSYAQAVRLRPQDADLLADYADTLAMARGRRLEGEPMDIVKRALEINPRHVKALALAGSAEFEAKRYAAAVDYWERLLPLASEESDFGRSIRRGIGQARELGQLAPARAAAPAPAQAKPPAARSPKPIASAAKGGISGTVRLAPALQARVSPEDAVFIFARPAEGARSPLAIVRVAARELPYAFRLEDDEATVPNRRLADQASLMVIARVSKTGNAIAKAGDLEGTSKPVAPGASAVEVLIDQIRSEVAAKPHP